MKPTASMILAAGHGGNDNSDMPDSGSMGGESAMADLMDAMKSGDPSAMWKAFKMASNMADSMPHSEGEHEDDDEMGMQ